jgi:hypothetical protein
MDKSSMSIRARFDTAMQPWLQSAGASNLLFSPLLPAGRTQPRSEEEVLRVSMSVLMQEDVHAGRENLLNLSAVLTQKCLPFSDNHETHAT